jgi:preprotein translocase subunit SecE
VSETHAEGATRPRGEGSPRGLGRLAVFLRQVVAELKKVVRPTRTELVTYTSVVLVFVLAVMAFVGALDLVFGRLVLWVFGGES